MKPAYHVILVALASGMLTFAFLALTYRFWFRPKGRTATVAWEASAAAAFYTAALGTVFLIMAAATGLLVRPLEALLSSPITQNKMLVTSLAILCWLGHLFIHRRGGAAILDRQTFASHACYAFALAGFVFLLTINSIGGDLAGIPSGYEQVAQALGYRTRHALYFPTPVNILLPILGIAAILLTSRLRRRAADRAVSSTSRVPSTPPSR